MCEDFDSFDILTHIKEKIYMINYDLMTLIVKLQIFFFTYIKNTLKIVQKQYAVPLFAKFKVYVTFGRGHKKRNCSIPVMAGTVVW